MVRPYAGAAGTHIFLGSLSMAAGIAWICILTLYEPLFINEDSLVSRFPIWLTVILSSKIICGFWFFLTGVMGCCIKSRGCLEGMFVAFNVLNVIIWAPILLFTMAVVSIFFIYGPLISLGNSQDDLDELKEHFAKLAWLWVFPGVGILVGIVEFILSIVSYSIVCCCRPSAMRDGYEYQYEMK